MHSTKLFGPKMYYLAVIIGLLIIYTVMVNNLNTIHPLERKIKAKSPSITLTNISRQHKNINELVPLNHTTILQRRISSCYQFPDDSSGSLLADISNAKLKPSDGRSIFFLMTSCSWKGTIALKARQVCAVESAAYHNPNRTIFILFASPVDLLTNTQSETLAVLQSYKNIHIQNINLDTFVEGTLAEDFYRSGKLFASKTLIEHMSDFLRLLVLYKYGGIYLDTDVVVQKNLDELPANFLGKEAYEGKKVDGVNNAVMGFQDGQGILELCIKEFISTFKANEWSYNGPKLLTRILENRLCHMSLAEMTPQKCRGLKVFPPEEFYAINWDNWPHFLDVRLSDDVLEATNNSSVVHFYNHFWREKLIMKSKSKSRTAYETISEKNCPKAFKASGDYF